MTENRTNRILITAVAAVGLAAGAAGIAGAATGGDAGGPDPAVARAEVPGTVTSGEVEDEDGREGPGDDGEETSPEQAAALTESATVSQDEAEQTARAEAAGTVHAVQIEDEDGTIVWDVEIDGDDGSRHDIQVDAATGEIVEHDIDDD